MGKIERTHVSLYVEIVVCSPGRIRTALVSLFNFPSTAAACCTLASTLYNKACRYSTHYSYSHSRRYVTISITGTTGGTSSCSTEHFVFMLVVVRITNHYLSAAGTLPLALARPTLLRHHGHAWVDHGMVGSRSQDLSTQVS